MITFKNHTISDIVVSTIMGHAGNGMSPLTLWPAYRRLRSIIKSQEVTNLTKSSTYEPHDGNFFLLRPRTWKYIQPLEYDGLLNAYGLTNQGVAAIAPKIAAAHHAGYRVIPNFYPQFCKGQDLAIRETLKAINAFYWLNDGSSESFWALELNFSCPNSREKIKENLADALACAQAIKKKFPELCLIAKISILHPYEFAQELVSAGVDVIHAINTIPYGLIYPNGPSSPLARVGGGGVSGGPAFSQALYYNRGLRKKIKAPIIMGCGVMSVANARRYFVDCGADTVSLCTVCRCDPEEAIRIISGYSKNL